MVRLNPISFFIFSRRHYGICADYFKKSAKCSEDSVNLSRQDEGDEMFRSSAVARSIVRSTMSASESIAKILPDNLKRWADSRFNKDVMIMENGAAFDLIRASVNLVLAGLLIALGTSLKLPLSTTYVTFMVAMGSSLAEPCLEP